MKSKILHIIIGFILSLGAITTYAQDQEDLYDYVFPDESHLKLFEAYSPFKIKKKTLQEDRIMYVYQAEDANIDSKEHLDFQISLWTLDSEEEAQNTFANLTDKSSSPYFQYGNPRQEADILGWIQSQNRSFHAVFLNRNRIFQYSLFQKETIFNRENYLAFKEILDENESIQSWFETVHDGILKKDSIFNQLKGDFYANKETSHKKQTWPQNNPHQSISYEISTDPSPLNKGTILDSSGSQAASSGDYYVYLTEGKYIELAIYAPEMDSNCSMSNGWHRVRSNQALTAYEWNSVKIIFGIGGLSLRVNNNLISCDIKQGIANQEFYLGDYPLDPHTQSAVFTIRKIEMKESYNSEGETWQNVFEKHPMPDELAWNNPSYEALFDLFQILKKDGETKLDENKKVTRLNFIKYLYKNYQVRQDTLYKKLPFHDLTGLTREDRQWIQTAFYDNILKESLSVRANESINRAEALTILARFRQYKQKKPLHYIDVPHDAWYLEGASYASIRKLIRAEIFDPSKPVTITDLALIFFELNH